MQISCENGLLIDAVVKKLWSKQIFYRNLGHFLCILGSYFDLMGGPLLMLGFCSNFVLVALILYYNGIIIKIYNFWIFESHYIFTWLLFFLKELPELLQVNPAIPILVQVVQELLPLLD